jgi:hypothetical protein
MIGSRDARYAVTRKETQIVELSLAGNASRINYSFKDCSNVGYGRVWGEGPPTPESSFAIYRHQQTGGLCRAEMQDRSRFVSITGIEVAASVSYITKPAQVQSLASCFWSTPGQFERDAYADTAASCALKMLETRVGLLKYECLLQKHPCHGDRLLPLFSALEKISSTTDPTFASLHITGSWAAFAVLVLAAEHESST